MAQTAKKYNRKNNMHSRKKTPQSRLLNVLSQKRLRPVLFLAAWAVVGLFVLWYKSQAQEPMRYTNKGIMTQAYPSTASDDPYVDYVTGGPAIQWDELEPTDNNFSAGTAWAKIDALLNNSKVKGVRLRIYAGRHAPNFVKQNSGPAVSGDGVDCSVSGGIAVINPFDNVSGCVPYFWRDYTLAQYQELMQEVNRRYGANPKLREVVSSACMTTYAEPFYRAHTHAASNARLWRAGLNEASDLYCEEKAMQIHSAVFPAMRVSLAINTWEIIVDPATNSTGMRRDWPATKKFVDKWKGLLGEKMVLQNNGWGENDGCPSSQTPDTNAYCYLKAAPQPKGFQSETWSRLGDSIGGTASTYQKNVQGWYQALENAINMGACFVEASGNDFLQAPPAGEMPPDPAKLADYDRRLEANCIPDTQVSPVPVPALTLSGITNDQTVSGSIAVEAIPANATNITQIAFYLDGSGTAMAIEKQGPYCLAGDNAATSTSPTCNASDTTKWANGTHTLKAVMSHSGGTTQASVVFAVSNTAASSPPPSPTGDTTAPTTPANVRVTSSDLHNVSLSWTASSDDVGVKGYYIYRSDSVSPIAFINGTIYRDQSVNPNKSYTYRVSAIDARSNESAKSGAVTASTRR
jgi:hypothetical protein